MTSAEDSHDDLADSEAKGGGKGWPPKLSARRLFTLGIAFMSFGMLAGEWIMPAVASAASSALGPNAQVGSFVVFGLAVFLTKLMLPLGIGMFSASLVVRALDSRPSSQANGRS